MIISTSVSSLGLRVPNLIVADLTPKHSRPFDSKSRKLSTMFVHVLSASRWLHPSIHPSTHPPIHPSSHPSIHPAPARPPARQPASQLAILLSCLCIVSTSSPSLSLSRALCLSLSLAPSLSLSLTFGVAFAFVLLGLRSSLGPWHPPGRRRQWGASGLPNSP